MTKGGDNATEAETTTTATSTSKPPPEPLLQQQQDDDDILTKQLATNSRWCYPFLPCFGPRPSPSRLGTSSSASVWERLTQTAEAENKWWAGPMSGLKKAREWSEIIAGPKWKTFIRRFSRFNRAGRPAGSGSGKFGYDLLSYKLNFDEGQNGNLDEDGGYFPDFSSRFATIPLSSKSSMDLGNNGNTKL